jgi:signal transduction histidine kinase
MPERLLVLERWVLERWRRRPLLIWGTSLLLVAAGLGLRLALDGVMTPGSYPLVTFLPAVLIAAMMGGFWPGMVATVLSSLASWFFLLEPAGRFGALDAEHMLGLVLFFTISLLNSILAELLHQSLRNAQAARRKAEALAAEMERRVAERTRALEAEQQDRRRAEEALAQARHMESLGRLTGGIAHDFNNLLTVVIGQADRIAAATPDERLRGMARLARRAAERGADLTRQLLAFSRRQVLQPRSLDMAHVLPPLRELIARTIGETIAVTAEAAPGLWMVRADPAQFESAILNLAINARDAMPEGGSLRLRAANLPLSAPQARELRLEPGNYVALQVTDTGHGMDGTTLAHAFEPFFTTKPVGSGSGLGLAQTYGFVRQSGGSITVESLPGRGTSLTLYLPRADGTEAAEPAAGPGEDNLSPPGEPGALPQPPRGGRSVLLVEDQPDLRRMMEETLREAGWRVQAVADGAGALEALRTSLPDLLLTDVVLPGGVSGTELGRYLCGRYPGARVLLMSGLQDHDVEGTGFPFLGKPFGREELLRVVSIVLNDALRETPANGDFSASRTD